MRFGRPERQLRLHQANLLRAVEKRDWERFARFLADDYSDRWGHDKEFVLSESRAGVSAVLVFEAFGTSCETSEVDDDRGMVAVSITLEGTGGPLAQFAKAACESALTAPFTFRWRHVGGSHGNGAAPK